MHGRQNGSRAENGCSVAVTGNGWTNDDQCRFWFENVLVPQARAKTLSDDEHVLLIFDGHHSHLTDELYDLGIKYKIDFYKLPSHTTHKLQPLDVGCFGPMQKRWIARCEEIAQTLGRRVRKEEFVKEYLSVRDASITPEVVHAAWRKTGLYPFDPDIFTEADFAPSRPWSTQAHLPASFPATIPATSISTPSVTEPERAPEPSQILDVEGEDDDAMDIDEFDDPMDVDTEGIPACPSLQEPVSKRDTVGTQLRVVLADLERLEALYYSEFGKRQQAEVHCANALVEIRSLKLRLNGREQHAERKDKKFSSKAVFLMSPEAQAEREARRAERVAKEQGEADKRERQAGKERDDEKRRASLASDTSVQFTGSLKGKKKADLQDIAYLLGIKDLNAKNDDLNLIIRSRLLNTEQHRSDPRFAKLYTALDRESRVDNIPTSILNVSVIAPSSTPTVTSRESTLADTGTIGSGAQLQAVSYGNVAAVNCCPTYTVNDVCSPQRAYTSSHADRENVPPSSSGSNHPYRAQPVEWTQSSQTREPLGVMHTHIPANTPVVWPYSPLMPGTGPYARR